MSVQPVDLDEVLKEEGHGAALLDRNMALVEKLKVKVEVVVGNAELTIAELFALKHNSMVRLDRDVDAPLELFLDGRLIGRGTLVVVDDNFGIRITEIAGREENVESD